MIKLLAGLWYKRKPAAATGLPAMADQDVSRYTSFMRQRRSDSGAPGHRIEYIYEDKDIVVVEKPEGLPVIAPEGSRAKTLYDIVTAHIQRVNPRGRAAVVHRLDRDTSGVMVFAKHAGAKKALMDNWNGLVKERGYTAVVEGSIIGKEGTFDTWLVENRAGQVYGTAPGTQGALRAITHWKVLSSNRRYSLLSLNLETGRKHQLRVQLSEAGYPIAGDPRYGARSDPLGRLCLHATILGLEHPFTHDLYSFESPPPEGFLRLTETRGEESAAGPHGPRRERPRH